MTINPCKNVQILALQSKTEGYWSTTKVHKTIKYHLIFKTLVFHHTKDIFWET